MFQDILVVCLGNICRSPMAEGLLRHRLRAVSSPIRVGSAGLSALTGRPPADFAIDLLQPRGIDISAHRARPLTHELLHQSDLVLVMDKDGKRAVETMAPSARGKVYRLGEWSGFDIPDPYQQPREAFARTLQLIERGIDDWLLRLSA